jgi:hypothetical protein
VSKGELATVVRFVIDVGLVDLEPSTFRRTLVLVSWEFAHLLRCERKPFVTPTDAYWRQRFTEQDGAICLNDLGNLCLTKDNSSYYNYSFEKKKGAPWGVRVVSGSVSLRPC